LNLNGAKEVVDDALNAITIVMNEQCFFFVTHWSIGLPIVGAIENFKVQKSETILVYCTFSASPSLGFVILQ
jgi:hypothetical protein